MIIFKLKNLMEKKNISRYKLQQLTDWNYKRINALFFSRAKTIKTFELEMLCDIFDCEIQDLMENVKKQRGNDSLSHNKI